MAHNVSLALSTYRANRLVFVGCHINGSLAVHESPFDRPMGLFAQDHAQGQSLWMAGRSQVWRFDNLLAPGKQHDGCDRLYVPAACFTTGEVNGHEIVLTPDQQPLFVNTAFSCLASLRQGYSFVPAWQPPFISNLTPDDRCHLNGVALLNGLPTWATACSSSDSPAGWRNHRVNGGVVVHIPENRTVVTGLSMPHSPRWHRGKLWLLNSGTGELGWIAGGRFESLCALPGFARGLAFVDGGDAGYAVVGLSKLRSPQFTGLPLEQQLNALGNPGGCCGLRVVDLASGTVIHSLDFPPPMDEMFDVVALPGVRQPRALCLEGEDIHCVVKLPGQPELTTIRPKAPSGNPHQAEAPPAFGVPLQAHSVRYQRVFQLTPQTVMPYVALTCPSLAPAHGRLARITGELFAVSAMAEGTMIGLAIAELQAEGQAALRSLMVQPEHRRRGIAAHMLVQLQRFLAQHGAHRLIARYQGSTSLATTLEPLLQRLGWSAPQTDFVLLKSNADKLSTADWNTRFALTAPYTVFPWEQATALDLSMAPQLGAPPSLCPPTDPECIDNAISVGLRHSGALVGWLIAHRLNTQTVRYSSLYVAPAHRAKARGLALLAEGFRRQTQAGIPRAKAAVAKDNVEFLRLLRRHLHPYLQSTGQSRSSWIFIAASGATNSSGSHADAARRKA